MKNCHGCKWLDRCKEDGRGYCCRVERSRTYQPLRNDGSGKLIASSKVREPNMPRCELYEPGEFDNRYCHGVMRRL